MSDSINRNIVECKVFYIHRTARHRRNVLIETLWNVKEYLDIFFVTAGAY